MFTINYVIRYPLWQKLVLSVVKAGADVGQIGLQFLAETLLPVQVQLQKNISSIVKNIYYPNCN